MVGRSIFANRLAHLGRSFKQGTMEEEKYNQTSNDKIVDFVVKQRVWDNVNMRYLIVNKTGLKGGHPKHTHINKKRPTEKHYRESSHSRESKRLDAHVMCLCT